jgi:hypothetical protein
LSLKNRNTHLVSFAEQPSDQERFKKAGVRTRAKLWDGRHHSFADIRKMRRSIEITDAVVDGSLEAIHESAIAQQRRVPRVGVLWHAGNAEEEGAYVTALLQGFKDIGYAEGNNIAFEHRFPNETPGELDVGRRVHAADSALEEGAAEALAGGDGFTRATALDA